MNAKVLFTGFLVSAALLAQPPAGPRGFGPGPGGPGGRGFGGPGGPPNAVVAGAPYSGVEVRTMSQALTNGTVIQNQEQTKVARDGQGRVRRETTRQTPDGKTVTRISISDPVAAVVYELDPTNKMAFSRPARFPNPNQQPSGAAGARNVRQPQADPNVTHETMAARSMNGVTASGTRTTRTIPAGTIGNSAAIQTVHEVWMADDLKVPVRSQTTDPRHGTTTTELTNILRGEPDASLFQVPSDYTLRKGPGGPGGRGPGGPMRKQ